MTNSDDRSPERSTQPGATSPPEDVSLGSAWYTVGVLTLIYVFSFLDRSILTLLVEPIKADLGLSDSQMSYLLGFSFAVFYVLFGLPLGRLADRTNRTRLIAGGLAFWSAATAMCGMAGTYWQLLLARIGVGAGEATLGPSAMSIISDRFPREKLTTAISVYSTGIYLGAGLSTIIGGYVAAFASGRGDIVLPLIGSIRPWQLVFFVVGGAGVVPLALLLATVREPIRKGAARAMVPIRDVFRYIGDIRGAVLSHHIGFAVLAFSGYGLGAWIPTFMVRTHQWPIEKVGLYLGINGVVTMTVGIVCGGIYADHLAKKGLRDAKMRMGVISAFVWLPLGIAYPLVSNGDLAFWLIVPASFASAFSTGAAAAAIQEIMPNRMRGQATAIYFFVANLIGMGLGPSAVAWSTDYLFRDEAALRYSIVLVGGATHLIAGIAFLVGLAPYRRSLDRLEEWNATPTDGA